MVLGNSFKNFISAHLLLNRLCVQNLSYQQRNVFIHCCFSILHWKVCSTFLYFIICIYIILYFVGAQKFDVIWLHNNKEIKPSKDFQYTNEANIYKLNIAEIFPEDSGIYTCEAFNDAGESFSSCTLVVLGMHKDQYMRCCLVLHSHDSCSPFNHAISVLFILCQGWFTS